MASKENRVLLPLCLNSTSSGAAGKSKTDLSHLSPVTDLTLNLFGLSTGHSETPRRKISWSGGTPVTTFFSSGCADSPAIDSPMFPERLLKQVSIENYTNCTTLRRLHTFPSRALEPRDKENVPANRLVFSSPVVDSDSEDSGCHLTQDEKQSVCSNSETSTSFPSKLTLTESPNKELDENSSQANDASEESLTHRLSFVSDWDDGFAIFNMDDDDSVDTVPSGLSALVTAPLFHQHVPRESRTAACPHLETRKAPIRRCLSMVSENEQGWKSPTQSCSSSCGSLQCTENLKKASSSCSNGCDRNNNNTQEDSRKRLCNDENISDADVSLKIAFKRPEPPGGVHAFESKRRKSVAFVTRCSSDTQVMLSAKKQPLIQRSHSASEATIKLALQRSVQEPDLIGDFTKTFALPLEKGKHQDLKSISIHSLAGLMKGSYSDVVDNFIVVDCRYPYEYEGGHVQGSKNIYTKEGILEQLLSSAAIESSKNQRHLVVFHCEFSSERGPALYRFLRNKDRESNKDNYPKLFHPELYVLEGGYKAFYEEYKEFCVPQFYKPMLHKDHENDLRKFRAKSKSWNGDSKSRVAVRPGLKL